MVFKRRTNNIILVVNHRFDLNVKTNRMKVLKSDEFNTHVKTLCICSASVFFMRTINIRNLLYEQGQLLILLLFIHFALNVLLESLVS